MNFKTRRNVYKYKKRIKDRNFKESKNIEVFKIVKKYALPAFVFSIFIYFIFYINPKDAWVSFNGKFKMMQLSGNVCGSLDAKIHSIDIPEGTISNYQPIIFEYDNKSIELKEEEFKINFGKEHNIFIGNPLEFANDVSFYSRNNFITKELNIKELSVKINGGEIYSGVKHSLYDKVDEKLEGISWELSGNQGIEIDTKNYNSSNDFEIFIKGVRLGEKEIKSHNIKIKSTFENPYIRLYVITKMPVYFDMKKSSDLSYSGRADNIIFFTSTNASLTFINSATPQVLQIPLTSVSIKRIKFESNYNNNDEYLNDIQNVAYEIKNDFSLHIGDDSVGSKEENIDYLNCLISGRVDDVLLSGKSLFPNFMQWIRYNSNTVTTILITSFISLMFALITRKE